MASYVQQQQQLILRLPDDLALRMHELLKRRKATDSREVKTGGVTLSSKIDGTVAAAAAESGTGKDDDDNESIEATVRPVDESNPSNDFIWCMDGKEYPALLMNLPTVVESHKTFDNKTFLKSGDIGQMLQVFHTNEEKDVMRNKIHKHTLYGEYMPSGLTPPTIDIVKRKFELTRKNDHSAFLPYRIRQVHDDINNFGMHTSSTSSSSGNQGRNSSVAQNHASVLTSLKESYARYLLSRSDRKDVEAPVVSESVLEEVVDFEEWMIDPMSNSRDVGITATVHDGDWFAAEAAMLLQHPELLVTDEEREEESFDALAAEEKKAAQAKQAADTAVAIVAGDNSRISSSFATAQQKSSGGVGDDAESSEKSILRLSRSFSTSMQTNPTSDEDMIADEVEDEGVLNESADGGEEDDEEEEEEGRNENRSVGSEDSDTAWMRDN